MGESSSSVMQVGYRSMISLESEIWNGMFSFSVVCAEVLILMTFTGSAIAVVASVFLVE